MEALDRLEGQEIQTNRFGNMSPYTGDQLIPNIDQETSIVAEEWRRKVFMLSAWPFGLRECMIYGPVGAPYNPYEVELRRTK